MYSKYADKELDMEKKSNTEILKEVEVMIRDWGLRMKDERSRMGT